MDEKPILVARGSIGLSPNDRPLPDWARGHSRRGGSPRRVLDGAGGRLHHRQRLPDGWWRHGSLLVRRIGFELTFRRPGRRAMGAWLESPVKLV